MGGIKYKYPVASYFLHQLPSCLAEVSTRATANQEVTVAVGGRARLADEQSSRGGCLLPRP